MVVPADDPRVPVGARRLVAVGRANGWRTCVAYARGTAMDARGRPGRVVDDVGVRFQRGSQGAVAYWTDGGFDFAYLMTVVGGERSPVSTRLGARALRAALDTPEEQT